MTASTVPGFSNRQLWLVLGTLMLAVLLASMEISIISTALPTIVGEFQAFESFAWVGTAYIVTAAIGRSSASCPTCSAGGTSSR